MKQYPTILNNKGQNHYEFDAYTFDKLDGSNLRFEWGGKKTGWYKYGTRSRLFDETDPDFGIAIPLFHERLAEGIEKVAIDSRWERLIVFCEFWGIKSFAGEHFPDDPKFLTIIDADIYKKGMMEPKEFLKAFSHLDIPQFFGVYKWNREFTELVRQGKLKGITFEGVVGKMHHKNKIVMRKAKTQAWIDAVLEKYGIIEGQKIIDS
jgi:hypothetical protein